MGNFRFVDSGIGYVSPGHNSTYYDEESGKYFIISTPVSRARERCIR